MRVTKIDPGERTTTVALTDRELLLIEVGLLTTVYATEENEQASDALWLKFNTVTKAFDLEAQGSALYKDTR